jgi:neutral trehalase
MAIFETVHTQHYGPREFDIRPTAAASAVDLAYPTPSEYYGLDFYDAMTESGLRADGIDYADSRPREGWTGQTINDAYQAFKYGGYGDMTLQDFINMTVELPTRRPVVETESSSVSIQEHTSTVMRASYRHARKTVGSHIGVEYPVYTAGGRFDIQEEDMGLLYNWDGLAIARGAATMGAEGITGIRNMLNAALELVDKLDGNYPNTNATWARDRSQPPVIYRNIRLLCKLEGNNQALHDYLPLIEKHYNYWRRGADTELGDNVGDSHLRVVRMPAGADGRPRFMYRFYDEGASKGRLYRDEMRAADKETFHKRQEYLREIKNDPDYVMTETEKRELAENLAAAAADGEDFTLNATDGGRFLHQVRTTKMISAKLNALQHDGASMAATAYYEKAQWAKEKAQQSSDFKDWQTCQEYLERAQYYEQDMLDLAECINTYCINDEGFVVNYDFENQKQLDTMSLSGVFALSSGIVGHSTANKMLDIMNQRFLRKGGLVMTLYEDSPEQWDYKIWPMIQMDAIDAAVAYGRFDLAQKWCKAFLDANDKLYEKHRALYEKSHPDKPGEYGEAGEYECVKDLLMSIGADMALRDKLKYIKKEIDTVRIIRRLGEQGIRLAAWPYPIHEVLPPERS